MRPTTMADIARQAGVSRIAVSYALNGRPGVSESLRRRIIGIAGELGYRANGPALALHGAAARAFGLVMLRTSALAAEVFRRELIAGIQDQLGSRGFGLALQFVGDLVEEMTVHRRWAAERRVDGVLIVDLRTDDPRLAATPLPTVVVGGAPPLPGVWCDETAGTAELVAHLAALGHRRIARVSGPAGLRHTAIRDATFIAVAEAHGLTPTVRRGDYSGDSGARLTRGLVQDNTAIVYDNDVMAVAGLGTARELGLGVPSDVSIVACEDSPLCQVVGPPLTVLKRDIVGLGGQAARLLFDLLDGRADGGVRGETPRLVVRRSTGPAPR